MTTEESHYAALLIDFESEDFPLFKQVQLFSPDEYNRYRAAYEILSSYLDESMFTYVNNCCIDLMDYIIKIGLEANNTGRIRETDERGSNIFDVVCSLTLSAVNSFFVVQDQHRLKGLFTI